MKLLERAIPDEIRGVGPFHSRVHPATEDHLDRMYQKSGVIVPWLPASQEDEEQEERLAFQIIRRFAHFFVHMRGRELLIFHARLQGLEWQEIADAIIGDGCSAQAAQNEFRKTLERFPELDRVFQERQPNGKKEHA